jgi:hypothetical protein
MNTLSDINPSSASGYGYRGTTPVRSCVRHEYSIEQCAAESVLWGE